MGVGVGGEGLHFLNLEKLGAEPVAVMDPTVSAGGSSAGGPVPASAALFPAEMANMPAVTALAAALLSETFC